MFVIRSIVSRWSLVVVAVLDHDPSTVMKVCLIVDRTNFHHILWINSSSARISCSSSIRLSSSFSSSRISSLSSSSACPDHQSLRNYLVNGWKSGLNYRGKDIVHHAMESISHIWTATFTTTRIRFNFKECASSSSSLCIETAPPPSVAQSSSRAQSQAAKA